MNENHAQGEGLTTLGRSHGDTLRAKVLPIDKDEDGSYEGLLVSVDVPVAKAGEFRVLATLEVDHRSFPEGTRLVAQGWSPGSASKRSALQTIILHADSVGTARLEVYFDGEDIRKGPSGQLFARLLLEAGEFVIPVHIKDAASFGSLAGHILDVEWNQGDSIMKPLRVRLQVVHSGRFVVNAYGFLNKEMIATGAIERTLEPGQADLGVDWEIKERTRASRETRLDEVSIQLTRNGDLLESWTLPGPSED